MNIFFFFLFLSISSMATLMTSINGFVNCDGDVWCSPLPSPLLMDSSPLTPSPPRHKMHHIAVEGVIYCKTCKVPGYNHQLDASPIPGATAKLECKLRSAGTSKPYHINITTNDSGYFYVRASAKVSNMNVERCRVFLESSPMTICKRASNGNNGVSGSRSKFETKIVEGKRSAYHLYTTGILYFDPTHHNSCIPE